ncbi:unnamed protein product [Rangifer tarandus platyrhynchus]|uniref:Uncharacterized protein n=1 Tax=Rangifer tarandus platyrhynchus TaxID=3082113 RepID=A0AC59Y3M1_RANTA
MQLESQRRPRRPGRTRSGAAHQSAASTFPCLTCTEELALLAWFAPGLESCTDEMGRSRIMETQAWPARKQRLQSLRRATAPSSGLGLRQLLGPAGRTRSHLVSPARAAVAAAIYARLGRGWSFKRRFPGAPRGPTRSPMARVAANHAPLPPPPPPRPAGAAERLPA